MAPQGGPATAWPRRGAEAAEAGPSITLDEADEMEVDGKLSTAANPLEDAGRS